MKGCRAMKKNAPLPPNTENTPPCSAGKKAYALLRKYIVTPIKKLYAKRFAFCVVSALVINLFIEVAGRRNLSRIAQHIVFNPHMFLYGALVIAFTLCISLFFKRRLFVYSLIVAIWLTLGICNARLLGYRTTPLVLIDFKIMRSSISLSTMYLSVIEIILLVLVILAALVGLFFLFRFSPKEKVDYKKTVLQTIGVAASIAVLVTIFSVFDIVDPAQRLPDDYDNCGYVYCLTYSFADTRIGKPEKYSKEDINAIKKVIDSVEETCPDELPNIIVLQLESFMDMYRIDGIEFADGANPHPYFSSLKESYPGGKLTVNALGACTANVEYEFLTSTDIRDYGFDNYPYEGFLGEQAMESVAYVLKELGYATTAIHNHNGGFYGRNEAYAGLGFDRFISKEAMGVLNEEDYTYQGWVRDEKLIEQIRGTLVASAETDFIMTVTVQCHSKYLTYRADDIDYPVEIIGPDDDEELNNMLMYYAAQAREEDEFLQALLSSLNEWASETGEETLVIMYGDHLPTFITSSEQLVDYASNPEAKYDSEYVLWWTDGLNIMEQDSIPDAQNKALKAFELAPYSLDLLGIRAGNIMRLYCAGLDEQTLAAYRNALAYDMLEGNNYFFNGDSPYKRTELTIGLTPLTVTNYYINSESLFIEGSGFTPSAYVYINNSRYSTGYISERLLEVIEQVTLENGDEISASLMTYDYTVLSTSNKYVVENIDESGITANPGKRGHHFIAVTVTVSAIVLAVVLCGIIGIRKYRRKKAFTVSSVNEADIHVNSET